MRFDSHTRREVLQKATVTGVGLTAVSGITAASENDCKDFTCTDGIYVKYELVELEDGTCEFQEETDTGIFDGLTIEDTKDGDSCEPIAVSWDDSTYEATKVAVFGGNDCEIVSDPNGYYRSGLTTYSGTTAAISNIQFCVQKVEKLECPTGTRRVASYDVDGSTLTFTGGEDVVTVSNKQTSDGYLTGFDFASTDGSDGNDEPETLTTVTVEYDSTVETFEVDPDFSENKQAGSVSVDGKINRVLFCAATYVQADFVYGDEVYETLCDNQYSDRKLSSITWSSYNGQLDGAQGQFDGSWEITDSSVTVNYGDSFDETLSLAIYEVDDPEFQENTNISFSDTRCRQTLFDSDTDVAGELDGTLIADLPTPSS